MKIVLCSSLNRLSYFDLTLVSLDKLKYLGLTSIFVTEYSKFLITIHKIKDVFLLIYLFIYILEGSWPPNPNRARTWDSIYLGFHDWKVKSINSLLELLYSNSPS